jgi:uncharacterized YigZ family protein
MLFSDTYNEVVQNAEASLRERGSKFLAYSYIVYNELEVKKYLSELKSQYPDATHHCYAYVIGQGSEAQRANDDGEPSNSAGKPILRAILSKQLTNVLVVVVRYFGGTLLGIPGLIESYGASAALVLSHSGKLEKMMEEQFSMATDFQHEQEIHRILNQFQVRILNREYNEKVIYTIAIRKNQVMLFEKITNDSYLVNLQINK